MDHALVRSSSALTRVTQDCVVASLSPTPCAWAAQVATVLAGIVIVLLVLLFSIASSKSPRSQCSPRSGPRRLDDGSLYEGFAFSQ